MPVLSYETVKSLWGATVARYHAEPGLGDLYLSSPKRSPRGHYRFFVPGTKTLQSFPHLDRHPVVFEKHIFNKPEGKPLAQLNVTVAKKEDGLAREIWKVFPQGMPQPLGVRKGALLTEGICGRSLKSLIPYISGSDGIADIGPAVFMASMPEGKADLMNVWTALQSSWDALKMLHRQGYAHGDAHLSNFLLCRQRKEWKALLIDFEFAGKLTPSLEAQDKQILLNHGRVLQALLGTQKGLFASEAMDMGFARKPQAQVEIVQIEKRVRHQNRSIPSLSSFRPASMVSAQGFRRERSIA